MLRFAEMNNSGVARYKANTNRLRALLEEKQRLTLCLVYASWLKAVVGIDIGDVKGLSQPIYMTQAGPFLGGGKILDGERRRMETLIKENFPTGQRHKIEFIGYKLRNGDEVLSFWPPFPDNVIYNKTITIPDEIGEL